MVITLTQSAEILPGGETECQLLSVGMKEWMERVIMATFQVTADVFPPRNCHLEFVTKKNWQNVSRYTAVTAEPPQSAHNSLKTHQIEIAILMNPIKMKWNWTKKKKI